MNRAELILMGAGPGDPDLITVKAWHLLRQAELILYDNLVNPALLDLAPPACRKISVGKQPYGPQTTQEEIHRWIRQASVQPVKIIRLKGGDPFIFGRGFEEAILARELGMKVTYIPGISSMQTAGFADIPLTHRAISDGIWIITGTRRDGSLSTDLRLALRSKATVVIYMGMKQLPVIAQLYRKEGYGSMPAAIIQNGSLPSQRIATGTAAQLPEMADRHQLSHPAVIVIGEVISLHRQPPHAAPIPEKHRAGLRNSPGIPESPAETGPINPPLVI